MLADQRELRRLPLGLGGRLDAAAGGVPPARRGWASAEEEAEDFSFPLGVPK